MTVKYAYSNQARWFETWPRQHCWSARPLKSAVGYMLRDKGPSETDFDLSPCEIIP